MLEGRTEGEQPPKALSVTEQNMRTSIDHARKLIYAKDLPEAARLQTFPDRFRFAGPPSAAFR